VRARFTAGWTRLGRRDRRAVLVGAVILAAAFGARAGVQPYLRTLSNARARVERERDLLHREHELLAEVKHYPAWIPTAERSLLDEAPRLFAGPELATASATLVNYVSTRAIRHRVFVQQSASRSPTSVASGVVRLQVDLRAVGDLEGILSLLQDLEAGGKLLTVDNLTIAQAEQVGNGSSSRDEEVLVVSATISGYALGDADTTQDTLAVTAQGAMQ
jgi:hypothetical protein